MSSLVAQSAPGQATNRLLEMLKNLGISAGELGTMVDKYATNLPGGDLRKIALGADANTQMALKRGLGKGASMLPGVTKEAGMRFAMSPGAKAALKVVPGLSFLGAGLAAGDVLLGDDSAGNRLMDAAAMGIGGALGAVGGPVGIAGGAALGKGASDLTQAIFGGGKSAEERKMEEMIRMLQNRG